MSRHSPSTTLLQVAVAPPTLVGYLTAGATPVWLLGSFAVLSLLYRADLSVDPAESADAGSVERRQASAGTLQPGAEVLTKRTQAERAYANLSADGTPVSAGQLAAGRPLPWVAAGRAWNSATRARA